MFSRSFRTSTLRSLPAPLSSSSLILRSSSPTTFRQPLQFKRFSTSTFKSSRVSILQSLHQQDARRPALVQVLPNEPPTTYSYAQVISHSQLLFHQILEPLLGSQRDRVRVAFLFPWNYSFVLSLLAIWHHPRATAVPLCPLHPEAEIKYVLEDSQSSIVLYDPSFAPLISSISSSLPHLKTVEVPDSLFRSSSTPTAFSEGLIDIKNPKTTEVLETPDESALILYTSGTTGRPKGVVMTQGNLHAAWTSLILEWKWNSDDRIQNILPLHHVHGLVNAVTTPLYAGACCELSGSFKADQVWSRFLNPSLPALTVFTAVPTVYSKLIQHYDQHFDEPQKQHIHQTLSKVRLFMSGSAALPETVMNRWRQISGHTLLERYGMTEVGMVLTNPLEGERKAGYVGHPFPFVEVRIVDPATEKLVSPGQSGELRIRGPTVFREYWGRAEATKETFDPEGWFKTGDIAVNDDGTFKILGRASVDIIKSGGYKISALEIERVLLELDKVEEVAALGLEEEVMGQIIGVLVRPYQDKQLSVDEIKRWCRLQLPPYKQPRVIKILEAPLPRNAMGKVNKKQLKSLFD